MTKVMKTEYLYENIEHKLYSANTTHTPHIDTQNACHNTTHHTMHTHTHTHMTQLGTKPDTGRDSSTKPTQIRSSNTGGMKQQKAYHPR
jgi:hypothetical protein